jgi:hypothetical protein
MTNKKDILKKRLEKLEKHYSALKEYKQLIDAMLENTLLYDPVVFLSIKPEQRAILDAYLKRFSSLQDFLGSKVFSLVLEVAGIDGSRMSEVLFQIEKERIIDSLDNWIELREIRNELEHEYPENLNVALIDLKFCIDNFSKIEMYYLNTVTFAKRYLS